MAGVYWGLQVPFMQIFSPAQCFGYVAFALGATAFLQKSDTRLKCLNGLQSIAYAVHFALLGAPPASASSALSGVRSLLSIKCRKPWLAAFFIAVNAAFGAVLVKQPVGWVPVFGTCVATYAVFCLGGIRMRVLLFMATLCWLANNIVTGSIGGTALEVVIGTANVLTMVRLLRDRAKRREEPAKPPVKAECAAQ